MAAITRFNIQAALIAAAIGLTALALFVPWQYTFSSPGAAMAVRPAPHAPVFAPPEPEIDHERFGVRVDAARASGYILGIVLVSTLAGLFRIEGPTRQEEARGGRRDYKDAIKSLAKPWFLALVAILAALLVSVSLE